jgi:hypothetical protein
MDSDDSKRDRSNADESRREGEVLGIGDVVPKAPGDPVTDYDEESVARRRARMRESEESESGTALRRSAGATGIDMGAGGEGTDIE